MPKIAVKIARIAHVHIPAKVEMVFSFTYTERVPAIEPIVIPTV